MTKNIEKLADFTNDGSIVTFDASVLSIKHEGKKEEKKPIVATLKLESTGEVFNISTWNFDLLDSFKSMSHSLAVATFEGSTTLYKDQLQIRVGKIKQVLAVNSKQKQPVSQGATKEEYIEFIETNIQNTFCKSLLSVLILNNEKFFRWPAARSVHHNFSGGLSLHSLTVAKNVLNSWIVYGSYGCFDKDIALTGALLHDIGKIDEYTEDCEISLNGQFMSHLVSGVLFVDRAIQSWNLTEEQKKIVFIIKHIIQSHHGKLEFGSPVVPKCMEAVIVSRADELDATVESLYAAYKNILPGTFTDRMRVNENAPIYKF